MHLRPMAGTPIAIWSFLAVAAFDSADLGSIHTTDLGHVCRRRADESRLSQCLEPIGYSYMQGRRDQNPSGGWHKFTSPHIQLPISKRRQTSKIKRVSELGTTMFL